MVVYDTDGSAHAVNFRETAPSAATTNMYHSNRTLAELVRLVCGGLKSRSFSDYY